MEIIKSKGNEIISSINNKHEENMIKEDQMEIEDEDFKKRSLK